MRRNHAHRMRGQVLALAAACALACLLAGCAAVSDASSPSGASPSVSSSAVPLTEISSEQASTVWEALSDASAQSEGASDGAQQETPGVSDSGNRAEQLRAALDIEEDYRKSFVHGKKPAKYQKYIMLHDTEGDGDAKGVIEYWDGNDARIAAHFVVNKDGSIVQCVKLDRIAHHAGFGDTGHNKLYGVEDESRDDKVGTVEIGEWASDYGMNSYSIGIELVHVGGSGPYPEKQLKALDGLIAYIDAYYGKESQIIDHKAWRSGNSDTSEEFAKYLKNYQEHRSHLP